MFDRNDVYINDNSSNNLFMAYGFFLKNIMEYYERTYKRIQDVISSIGGINQAITLIAIYLNTFYNNFIVLSDTELLLHSSIKSEKNDQNKKNKHPKNEFKDIDNKIKKNTKINKIKNKEEEENNKKYNNKSGNSTIKNNEISKSNNNISIINLEESNRHNKLKGNNENEIINKINNNNKEKKNFEKAKKFLDYICYKITCANKKKYFKIYENFRTKIISEEHLIRNHLNIYNLLRVTESKRHGRRNSYQLKDLIKLV